MPSHQARGLTQSRRSVAAARSRLVSAGCLEASRTARQASGPSEAVRTSSTGKSGSARARTLRCRDAAGGGCVCLMHRPQRGPCKAGKADRRGAGVSPAPGESGTVSFVGGVPRRSCSRRTSSVSSERIAHARRRAAGSGALRRRVSSTERRTAVPVFFEASPRRRTKRSSWARALRWAARASGG